MEDEAWLKKSLFASMYGIYLPTFGFWIFLVYSPILYHKIKWTKCRYIDHPGMVCFFSNRWLRGHLWASNLGWVFLSETKQIPPSFRARRLNDVELKGICPLLDGGNSNMFHVHPEPWGRSINPIWLAHIFQMGWWKTTNYSLLCRHFGHPKFQLHGKLGANFGPTNHPKDQSDMTDSADRGTNWGMAGTTRQSDQGKRWPPVVDLVVTGGRVGDGLEVPAKNNPNGFFWGGWFGWMVGFVENSFLNNMVGFVEEVDLFVPSTLILLILSWIPWNRHWNSGVVVQKAMLMM